MSALSEDIYVIGKLIAWTLAAVGALASIAAFIGPYWPTSPDISPGYPSTGSPMDVPFSLGNRSSVFAITGIKIMCYLDDIEITGNNHFSKFSIAVSGQENIIEPNSSRPYICPFNQIFILPLDKQVINAKISLIISYNNRVFWPWKVPTAPQSTDLTLDEKTKPSQWTLGRPLH